MRTIDPEFVRLARTFDAGCATRVRMLRKSDGWEVDLTDLCGVNWVRGVQYAEGLDNNTATFTVELIRSVGENTISPLRASKANRKATVADPVLAVKRLVIVDVQVTPPDGIADPDNWIELVRGYVDKITIGNDGITLQCRDESSRFIDRWQEYERNWPQAPPQPMEDVLQALLDTATYDPGPWVGGVTRAIGDLCRPTAHNGYLYRCTTAGVSGTTDDTGNWTLTPGNTATDGTATWTNVGTLPAAQWTAGSTKYLGSIVRPTGRSYTTASSNGYMYQCTATSGVAPFTTGGVEPTWPTTYGGTVVDNEVTWTLIEDMPDLFRPEDPSWSVTRAAADDYGLPPQSYWDIVRAFQDQIGWDVRFRWVDVSSRRRPVLRSLDREDSSIYTQNGDAGTFEAHQYEITGDVEFGAEHVRNIVEVNYFEGAALTQTRIRVEDADSIAAYGPQFCQLTLDSASLINSSAEATQLANTALAALKRPLVTMSVRVPFMPWIEVGDGIGLRPRPEDALFDATTGSGLFAAVVQGVSHRTDQGVGTTELQLQGFFVDDADTIEEMPIQTQSWMNRESRAKVGKVPTFKRPGDVTAHIYATSDQGPFSAGAKPGTEILLGSTTRDSGGNVVSGVFEAPVAGIYSITASVRVDPAPAAGATLFLTVVADGSNQLQVARPIDSAEAGGVITISVSGLVLMSKNSTAAAYLACDPATNVITLAGDQATFLSARLVR